MKLILITSLLICAVIATPFGNKDEHKTHHHSADKAHQVQHRFNKIGNRMNEKDPVGLEFFADGPSCLVAFLNTTSNVAVVFDFCSNFVLAVNGESGNGFAIDGNRHLLIKIDNLWNKAQDHFEKFYQSLLHDNLRNVTQKGKPSTDPADLHELNRIGYQLGIDSNSALALLAAAEILNQNRGVLKRILKDQRFEEHGDVLRAVVVLKGISELLQAEPESLDKADFDFPLIMNAQNGLIAFKRTLQSLRNLNLSQLLGNPLGNLGTILRIIVELRNYKSENGIDNVFNIIYNIYLVVTGHGCIDNLIRALLEIGSNGGVEIMGEDITQVIDETLKLAESQNATYGGCRVFTTFIEFLRELNQDNLFLSGINVSRLLTYLRRRDYRGAIDMIVNFLFRMNRVMNPAESVPRFFGILLSLFGDPRGCGALSQMVPGLEPGQMQQLQNVNLTKLLQNRQAFLDNPALRQVYETVSRSANNCSNGSFDANSLFNLGGVPGFNMFPSFGSGLFSSFGPGFFNSFGPGFFNGFRPGLGLFNPFMQSGANWSPFSGFSGILNGIIPGFGGGNSSFGGSLGAGSGGKNCSDATATTPINEEPTNSTGTSAGTVPTNSPVGDLTKLIRIHHGHSRKESKGRRQSHGKKHQKLNRSKDKKLNKHEHQTKLHHQNNGKQ